MRVVARGWASVAVRAACGTDQIAAGQSAELLNQEI